MFLNRRGWETTPSAFSTNLTLVPAPTISSLSQTNIPTYQAALTDLSGPIKVVPGWSATD